jgi:hypothetical protein
MAEQSISTKPVAPDWRDAASVEYQEKRAAHVRDRDGFLKQAEKFTAKANAESAAIIALDDAAKAFGITVEIDLSEFEKTDPTGSVGFTRSGPLFKDLALQLLMEAYPRALRAADIQASAEAKLGRKFHPKTTGMSLYRLAKDGAVVRRGWDWFYIPEDQRALPHSVDVIELDVGDLMPKTK